MTSVSEGQRTAELTATSVEPTAPGTEPRASRPFTARSSPSWAPRSLLAASTRHSSPVARRWGSSVVPC